MATRSAARRVRAGNPELRARLDPDRARALEQGLTAAGLSLAALLASVANAPPEVFAAMREAGGLDGLLEDALRVRADSREGAAEADAMRRQAESALAQARKQAETIVRDAERQAADAVKAAKAHGGIPVVEARLRSALGPWAAAISTAARRGLAAHGLPDTADNRVAAMIQAVRETVEESVQTLRRCQEASRAAQRDREAAVVAARRDRQQTADNIAQARRELEAVEAEARRARRRLDTTRAQLDACRADLSRMRQQEADLRALAVQATVCRADLQLWQAALIQRQQAIEAAEEWIPTVSTQAGSRTLEPSDDARRSSGTGSGQRQPFDVESALLRLAGVR